MQTEKFLEFHGKKITLVNKDGGLFIALKPICEVLEIDWESQRKSLAKHKFFSSVTCILQATGADGKTYDMVCLPEKYIYGWLCSLSPKTDDLVIFQQECYDVLYNHFHSLITTRISILQQRLAMKNEAEQLHKKLLLTEPNYKRILELQQSLKAANKNLGFSDDQLMSEQAELPFNQ